MRSILAIAAVFGNRGLRRPSGSPKHDRRRRRLGCGAKRCAGQGTLASSPVALLLVSRTCVLFVREIGYKDNFAGVFACNAPLRSSEIVRSEIYAGRTYISLAGYGEFEELYISAKRNDRSYDVYFDLN